MLDSGAARVHSCQGQPGVREGARVDSVPSQPHLRQLQSPFPSLSNRLDTWFPPVPHLLPHPASPPASLPSHTFTTPRLPSHWAGDSKTTDTVAQAAYEGEVWPADWHRDVTVPKADGGHKTEQRHEISIGDLRKYISVIKTGLAKQQTLAAAEIQEPSAPEVPVNNNTSVNVETSNMFSVLSGVEEDQLIPENCSSSSLDAATTYHTDPSHDSTIDSHDSTPGFSMSSDCLRVGHLND